MVAPSAGSNVAHHEAVGRHEAVVRRKAVVRRGFDLRTCASGVSADAVDRVVASSVLTSSASACALNDEGAERS